MHKPDPPGMASPTPEEKRAHEDRHLNRHGKRAKKSREKKAKRAAEKKDGPLVARIAMLTHLCQVQGDFLAQARRELRGSRAAMKVVTRELETLATETDCREWAYRVFESANTAGEHASQPHPDDRRVDLTHRVAFKSPAIGPSHVEIDPLPVAPKGDTKP